MKDIDYNNIIQEKAEKGIDLLMLIAGIVFFTSAFILYYTSISMWFAIFDVGLGLILFTLTIVRRNININTKIIISIVITFVIGISAFLADAFNSAGNILILIGNLLAIALLSKRRGIIVSAISIGLFATLLYITHVYMFERFSYIKDGEWLLQFIVFVFFILIMHKIVYLIRDYLITNIIKVETKGKEIYSLAFYDQLTGLPNQNLFRNTLNKKNRKKIKTGYVIIYKIKHLDVLNSIYGEEVGNQILINAADVFSKLKNNNDLLARNSGNEFVLWIENKSKSELVNWIENTNIVFNKNDIINYENIKLEFYISYAEYNSDDEIIEDCYRKAGLALTCAKVDDIRSVVVYDKTFEDNLYKEEVFKELLWVAIDKKEFEINYQQKVDALTGKVVGVEALARWNSDILGNVQPNIFIPLIEKANQSVEFGELIIDKAFGDFENLCNRYNGEIQLSINISPSHLIDKGFAKYLAKEIEKHKIEPNRIILEITEEVLMESGESVNLLLAEIRKLGVCISLDDFGTGYSSYNYLMKLEIDELKIDKSFIDQLCNNDKTTILLQSIIFIAKNYNLKLVAEGVETKEQKDKLVELGCNIIQGYYFAKPEPLFFDNSCCSSGYKLKEQ